MKIFFKIIGIIFLILFILILIALISGYFFLKNFDIKKYKPQIVQAASQALGRTVNFEDIELNVSIEKGVRFQLRDLSILDSPDFSSGNFAFVKEIEAGVDILPFLMSRQVSVPNVIIRSPQINIVHLANGSFNVESIGQPIQRSTQDKPSSSSPAAALPAIFVNSFKIEDAEIKFIEKSVQPEITLGITQLTLDVQRFSLTRPFNFAFEAAALASEKNVSLSGKAQLNLASKEVKFSDTNFDLDFNQLPIETLKIIPLLKGVPFPKILEGQLKVRIKEADVSDKGLAKINANIELANGKVVAKEIVPGISFDATKINLALENISLDGSAPSLITLKAALFQDQPNINLTGQIKLDPKTFEVQFTNGQFTTDLGLWPLQKIKTEMALLKDVSLPEVLSGKLQITIKDLLASSAGLKTILSDISLQDAELTMKNVIPGAKLEISDTDVEIKNFALDKPFTISLKTAYLNKTQNIFFDGNVGMDIEAQTASINEATVSLDFDTIPLDRLKVSGFIPTGVPFPQILMGTMNVRINDLAVSPKGMERIKTDLQWQNGKIIFDDVSSGISMAADKINLEVKNFSLKDPFDISGSLGFESPESNISFDGNIAFDLATQNIKSSRMAVKTDLTKIPFDRLKVMIPSLKDVPLPEVLKGLVEVNIKELTAGPKGLGSVLADISFKEGEVGMKEVAPGISLAASHINADIIGLAFNKPFGFDIQLAYLSDQPNISTTGKIIFKLEDQSIVLNDTTLKADLSTISMDGLKNAVVSLKDVPLPERLKGDLNISLTEVGAGPKGLSKLSGAGSLKNWEVKLKELALPIRGTDTNFAMTETLFSVEDFQAQLGTGKIAAKISMVDYMTRQDFDVTGEIKNLNLVEILDQKAAPVKVEGFVFASLNARGQAANLNSIIGDGDIEIKDAKLIDLNVLKTILDKISFLPNVSERVTAKLSEKYKAKLNSKDTEINKITTPLIIANGTATLDPISVEADEFVFSGKCEAGFDQSYALNGKVIIPTELSLAMAEGIDELKYLYDENSNISMPVNVSGKGANVPVFAVTQTTLDIGKNAMRNEGKKQLENVLNKVLGVQEQAPAGNIENQNQEKTTSTEPTQEQQTPGGVIIDSIFNNIFK